MTAFLLCIMQMQNNLDCAAIFGVCCFMWNALTLILRKGNKKQLSDKSQSLERMVGCSCFICLSVMDGPEFKRVPPFS